MRAADITIGEEYLYSTHNDWRSSTWNLTRVRVLQAPVRPLATHYNSHTLRRDQDGNHYVDLSAKNTHAEVEYLDADGNVITQVDTWRRPSHVPLRNIRQTWADSQERIQDIKDRNKAAKQRREEERERQADNEELIVQLNKKLDAKAGLEIWPYTDGDKIRITLAGTEGSGLTRQQRITKILERLERMAEAL